MGDSEDLKIVADELTEFADGFREIAEEEKAIDEEEKVLAERKKALAEKKKALAERFKLRIKKLFGVAEVKPKSSVCDAENKQWNPDRIKWHKTEGFKGEYERYPLEGEKPESTSDYRLLLEDLKKHDGKLTKDGWFYWLFEDGCTVGRKPRKFKGKSAEEANK